MLIVLILPSTHHKKIMELYWTLWQLSFSYVLILFFCLLKYYQSGLKILNKYYFKGDKLMLEG